MYKFHNYIIVFFLEIWIGSDLIWGVIVGAVLEEFRIAMQWKVACLTMGSQQKKIPTTMILKSTRILNCLLPLLPPPSLPFLNSHTTIINTIIYLISRFVTQKKRKLSLTMMRKKIRTRISELEQIKKRKVSKEAKKMKSGKNQCSIPFGNLMSKKWIRKKARNNECQKYKKQRMKEKRTLRMKYTPQNWPQQLHPASIVRKQSDWLG